MKIRDPMSLLHPVAHLVKVSQNIRESHLDVHFA